MTTPGPTVRITLPHGLVTDVTLSDAIGGTLKNPKDSITGLVNLKLIDYSTPGRKAIGLFNNAPTMHEVNKNYVPTPGEPIYFKSLEILDSPFLPFHGSTGNFLIPDVASHRRIIIGKPGVDEQKTRDYHVLLPGEVIPIFFEDSNTGPGPGVVPPDAAKCNAILTQALKFFDLSMLRAHPRFAHTLNVCADLDIPGVLDIGRFMREMHRYLGGPTLQGWHNSIVLRGGDGINNWHYDYLTWFGLRALLGLGGAAEFTSIVPSKGAAPTPIGIEEQQINFYWGLSQAYMHACLGRHHSGTWRGMAGYEKGEGCIGSLVRPAMEKQWLTGLFLWTLITDHDPILQQSFDEALDWLRNVNVDKVWTLGEWGERIPKHLLDELRIAYIATGDRVFMDKALQKIAQVWGLFDQSKGFWPNRGNGGTAESSPWMAAPLVHSILRWHKLAQWFDGAKDPVNHRTLPTIDNIKQMAFGVINTGMYVKHNQPATKYRNYPVFSSSTVPQANCFMIPLLREMKLRWGQLGLNIDGTLVTAADWYHRVLDFTMGAIGATWAEVAAGTRPNIADVDAYYGPQGPGYNKVIAFTLSAMEL